MRVSALVGLVGAALVTAPAVAQVNGTPSFNAPYRAFERSEVGATISFPRGGGRTGLEGQYRFGSGMFDIGLRGGMILTSGPADDVFVVGVEARNRVITHTEQFPLDGALIFGGGLSFNGGTRFLAPIGLSLGRRLNVEGSDVSIVPYVQPTGFLYANGGTNFEFGLGFGADFRLSNVFDARLSIGVGNGPEGIALSAVWVH